MNVLPKIPPSSVRSGSSMPPAVGTRSPEPRIYFMSTEMKPNACTLSLFAHESEDARLTGETRSLFRRLLALNLPVAYEASRSLEIKIEKIA